jgi:hypothetical protein
MSWEQIRQELQVLDAERCESPAELGAWCRRAEVLLKTYIAEHLHGNRLARDQRVAALLAWRAYEQSTRWFGREISGTLDPETQELCCWRAGEVAQNLRFFG